jgi:hypothetical protein
MHEQARDWHPRSAIEGVGWIEADDDLYKGRNAADAASDAMPGGQKQTFVDERATADRAQSLGIPAAFGPAQAPVSGKRFELSFELATSATGTGAEQMMKAATTTAVITERVAIDTSARTRSL